MYVQDVKADAIYIIQTTRKSVKDRTRRRWPSNEAALALVKCLGEGVEEFVSEFADAWFCKQLISSKDRSWKEVAHDAWYSALIGALTSAGLNAAVSAGRSPKALAKTLVDETARRVDAAESPQINAEMLMSETEAEKAERLKNAMLTVTTEKEGSGGNCKLDSLKHLTISDAGRILRPILKKFGIVDKFYTNQPMDISFEYTGNGAKRSIAHQYLETEGDFRGFALVQDNLEKLCENAYPLEMHADEKPKSADNHVTGIATMASLLRTNGGDIPVRMTIKFFDNSAPKLHVVINGSTPYLDMWTPSAHIMPEDTSAQLTIPEFFELVKDSREFGKRIPESIRNPR